MIPTADKRTYAFPLAYIREQNLALYSRCALCRMDQEGNLKSIEEDYDYVCKYLSR